MLTSNIVQFGHKYYSQQKGVPQGQSTSFILSSYYYSVIENNIKEMMQEKLGNNQLYLIMRMTDDYLILSTSIDVITLFKSELNQLQKYGILKFNESKIQTNLSQSTSPLIWIGLQIDPLNMSVRPHSKIDITCCRIALNVNVPHRKVSLWLCRRLHW
jgi:hypothetical protein